MSTGSLVGLDRRASPSTTQQNVSLGVCLFYVCEDFFLLSTIVVGHFVIVCTFWFQLQRSVQVNGWF